MSEKTDRQKAEKIVADNRKAFHDYHILETFEAGIALTGGRGSARLRDRFPWHARSNPNRCGGWGTEESDVRPDDVPDVRRR